MAIPSQASQDEGVETRRGAPKTVKYGEGIVQTTNRKGSENYSGTKICWAYARGSSSLPTRTEAQPLNKTKVQGTIL